MMTFPGLRSPRDQLNRAVQAAEDYLADPLNTDKAHTTAKEIHAIQDWVGQADRLKPLGYAGRAELDEHIYNQLPSLKAIRDLSNASKHGGTLDDRRKPWFQSAEFHGGSFSRGFDISCLELHLSDGTVLWYEDIVSEAIAFWREFFADHNL